MQLAAPSMGDDAGRDALCALCRGAGASSAQLGAGVATRAERIAREMDSVNLRCAQISGVRVGKWVDEVGRRRVQEVCRWKMQEREREVRPMNGGCGRRRGFGENWTRNWSVWGWC
jgi:hypothetical protein